MSDSGIEFVRFISPSIAEFRHQFSRRLFCLDKHNLEMRIKNLSEEAPWVDLSVEYAVLAEMNSKQAQK